jgi:hypothetical protein
MALVLTSMCAVGVTLSGLRLGMRESKGGSSLK